MSSMCTDRRRLAVSSPVIVSFHGGGWVYGDKNVYQFYCMELAKRGFAVVNYSYNQRGLLLAPRKCGQVRL